MIYVGIDPGLAGGIASVADGGQLVNVVKMPADPRGVFDAIQACTAGPGSPVYCRAVLEFVRSSPQMGVVSAFSFGCGYGGLRMALTASEIPFTEVTPQRWQAALGCRTRGDKNVSKARAQELFPALKVTHAIADALLLAEYCRRLHGG